MDVLKKAALLGLMGLGVYIAFAEKKSPSSPSSLAANAEGSGSNQPSEAAVAEGQPKTTSIATGKQQTAFAGIIDRSRSEFTAAQNDLAKGAFRQSRADELCQLLKNRSVSNWVGFLSELSSNSDGLGVITIDIGGGTEVKTWNNDFSDIGDKTMLRSSDPVFKAVINMKIGQPVVFSGKFMKGDADCIAEGSLTQSGSMENPEFIMRFTSLKAADPSLLSQVPAR